MMVCAHGPEDRFEFSTASVASERAPACQTIDVSAFKDLYITEAGQSILGSMLATPVIV
jgi:hypothetical protein